MRRSLNRKSMTLIGSSILVLLFCFWRLILYNPEMSDCELTLEDYTTYDSYGIVYLKNEAEIYELLKNKLTLDKFELVLETETTDMFTTRDVDVHAYINERLADCCILKEVGYQINHNGQHGTLESYYISYENNQSIRIILSYYSDGRVHKTIVYPQEGKVVSVTNDLKKSVKYMTFPERSEDT